MAKQKGKSGAKQSRKSNAGKSSKSNKPKQSILVVMASDRVEARRALAQLFKVNKPTPKERTELRRKMAASF